MHKQTEKYFKDKFFTSSSSEENRTENRGVKLETKIMDDPNTRHRSDILSSWNHSRTKR